MNFDLDFFDMNHFFSLTATCSECGLEYTIYDKTALKWLFKKRCLRCGKN